MAAPDDRRAVLRDAAERAAAYVEGLSARRVGPDDDAMAGLVALGGPLPARGTDAGEVLRLLDEHASPATVASAGPRYFGFVSGGTLPAALGASVLATAWDQNVGLEIMSPAAAYLEQIAATWLLSLLGLPAGAAVGFTTGATMGNLTALAAARSYLLAGLGWDVEEQGLFGAPEIQVIVGAEVHVSVQKALALLGLGRGRVVRVPADGQGRMRPDALPKITAPAIVCLQAGNVNTGAIDPLAELIAAAHAASAWVHIDGAFGLWALASPRHAALANGAELANSWSTDGHKWLNVPYDCGFAIVRDPPALHRAMVASAAYLAEGRRDGFALVPEMSRRARGTETWAALKSLGRDGVAELVDRCCRLATRFAESMRSEGFAILNEVVLNQAMVSFGDADRTNRVIAAVQREGVAWCGGTVWQGRTAMRFSVSSWATTEADIDRSVAAIVSAASATN